MESAKSVLKINNWYLSSQSPFYTYWCNDSLRVNKETIKKMKELIQILDMKNMNCFTDPYGSVICFNSDYTEEDMIFFVKTYEEFFNEDK